MSESRVLPGGVCLEESLPRGGGGLPRGEGVCLDGRGLPRGLCPSPMDSQTGVKTLPSLVIVKNQKVKQKENVLFMSRLKK